MNGDERNNLIKTWFEIRFNKKPEHDTIYFNEWVGRFAGLVGDETPWQMDRESRKIWRAVNSL